MNPEEENSLATQWDVVQFSKDIIKEAIDKRARELVHPDRQDRSFTGINDALAQWYIDLIERGYAGNLDKDSDAILLRTLAQVQALYDYSNKEKVVKHVLDVPKLWSHNIDKM